MMIRTYLAFDQPDRSVAPTDISWEVYMIIISLPGGSFRTLNKLQNRVGDRVSKYERRLQMSAVIARQAIRNHTSFRPLTALLLVLALFTTQLPAAATIQATRSIVDDYSPTETYRDW